MSAESSPPHGATIEKSTSPKDPEKVAFGQRDSSLDDYREPSLGHGVDILASQSTDPALDAKMHIVNNTIDEIGFTPYHWKLFVLNGFGYAVDSLLLLLQSVIATQAGYEFNPSYSRALTIAVYMGMLFGALFWGLSADMIGRRFAFNISLFICSIFSTVAGAAPNWVTLAVFIAFLGFGGGGNLIMDTTVFLEYLPSNKQWVLTFLASWWGLGQAITGFIAWDSYVIAPKWNCNPIDAKTNLRTGECPYGSNMGWRYTMYTAGALVFVLSIARITVIRLKETPKYLLGEGKDAQLVQDFQDLAAKGLFATKTIGRSTLLIWLSWTLIGLAYPLFYVFLNTYLSSRGNFSVSTYDNWRNYALVNVSGIPGPMLAAYMANWKVLGRKYTMVIGALLTMAFFFAYTQVRTEPQNVGFSCAIGFCLNIYYGTLYAYTPEVLPSAHRATGNGVAVACNRIMGIMSAVIATYANTATSVPIYLCAALYIGMAGVAIAFPFEPYGKRSS